MRTPGGEEDVRAVSLFVVNRRAPAGEGEEDAAFAFQVEMSVAADTPFVARGDAHGLDDEDWDERLADLHYRDAAEYAVGHNVSVHAEAAMEAANGAAVFPWRRGPICPAQGCWQRNSPPR